MARFSISTRNGRMRAESEDGENITLALWNTPGFSALLADHTVTVRLADLRQIVSHFDWLDSAESERKEHVERNERNEYAPITIEIDSQAFALALAQQIAGRLRFGKAGEP